MAISRIPCIDISAFFKEGYEDRKKKVKEEIGKACSEYGFFQILNHGIPLDLLSRALELSKKFFGNPVEEKNKSCSASPLATCGYSAEENFFGRNESVMMRPGSNSILFPQNPPELREVMEEMCREFQRTGSLLQGIMNECLGLPAGFLEEYNPDRSGDALLAWRYPPARRGSSSSNNLGRHSHQDSDCFTFVLQDEVGGLEVKKDGRWIPVTPVEGALVVNVGSILQVLSNKRFVSSDHRVLSKSDKSRYSFAYFYAVGKDNWVEPLPQLSTEIGEAPKYRGFSYMEFQQLRRKERSSDPPVNVDSMFNVDYYAIPTLK